MQIPEFVGVMLDLDRAIAVCRDTARPGDAEVEAEIAELLRERNALVRAYYRLSGEDARALCGAAAAPVVPVARKEFRPGAPEG